MVKPEESKVIVMNLPKTGRRHSPVSEEGLEEEDLDSEDERIELIGMMHKTSGLGH